MSSGYLRTVVVHQNMHQSHLAYFVAEVVGHIGLLEHIGLLDSRGACSFARLQLRTRWKWELFESFSRTVL